MGRKRWVFSNMLPMDEPLVYQGLRFATAEHFYHAMKLRREDVAGRSVIAALPSPYDAKRACKDAVLAREGRLREDWQEIKLDVMEFVLRHKFAPGTTWHGKLVATEGEIVEWTTWGDVWWGRDLATGRGENHLGRILMKIRGDSLAAFNGMRARA